MTNVGIRNRNILQFVSLCISSFKMSGIIFFSFQFFFFPSQVSIQIDFIARSYVVRKICGRGKGSYAKSNIYISLYSLTA